MIHVWQVLSDCLFPHRSVNDDIMAEVADSTADGLISQPGPSRIAHVSDEKEEIAAEEEGTVVQPTSTTETEPKEEEGGEEIDPNKIPDEACETLYIQNLNEKVRLPGESS